MGIECWALCVERAKIDTDRHTLCNKLNGVQTPILRTPTEGAGWITTTDAKPRWDVRKLIPC